MPALLHVDMAKMLTTSRVEMSVSNCRRAKEKIPLETGVGAWLTGLVWKNINDPSQNLKNLCFLDENFEPIEI